MSSNKSLIPPLVRPYYKELENHENYEKFIYKLHQDIKDQKYSISLLWDDDPRRETNQMIKEFLYELESKRIEEEMMFSV